MNILFINNKYHLFNDIDCGAANRSTLFVEALTNIGHVDVISFSNCSIKSNIKNCDVIYSSFIDNTSENHFVKLIDYFAKWIKLLIQPFSPYSYYSINREKSQIINHFYSIHHYDYVACRYVDEAVNCGLLKYSDNLIIDVDDNLVNALKRKLDVDCSLHFWRRWQFRYELKRIGKMAEKILEQTFVSFYSNRLEPVSSKSIYLHNTSTRTELIPDICTTTPKRILIVGWLDYMPNKKGVEHFVRKVFPITKEKMPEIELHIVGKTKDLEFSKWLNSNSGVKALGFVDDIMVEYKDCRAIIVPLYHGAGTSVKFVEGLLMNRPIVSTAMGVRGFEDMCVDGEHYMLARNDKDFATKIIKALSSQEESIAMAQKAYKKGIEEFSRVKFFEIVKTTIESKNKENKY